MNPCPSKLDSRLSVAPFALLTVALLFEPAVLGSAWIHAPQAASSQTTSADSPAVRSYNEGNTYFNAKNWAAAIPYFKSAVAADPAFAVAYYALGLSYYQNQNPKLAADAFQHYVKLKGNDAEGFLLLGISLRDAGNDAAAIDAFQTAINLKPEAKYLNSAYYNMGVAYENAHQLPEAMRTYVVLRTISPDDAQDLLDYMRSVDPDLKAADAPAANSPKTPPSSDKVPATVLKPAAPVSAAKPAPASPPQASLPDLPDLPAARTAIQAADLIKADDLTLTDVIFILQYRDASTSNQAAAKKVWSEVLDKEKDGEPLQISNAMVISSTKTTVELALSDDFKHAKEADTHLILAKSMSAPARAGVVTNISGVITSYKTNPFRLTIERGELLSANSAASTAAPPSASTRTAPSKPAPESTQSAPAPSAPAKRADGWIAYGNSDGNFTALLPNQPKVTPNAAEQGQVSNTIQSLTKDGVAYTVVYVRNGDAQPVDEQTFQLYRDNFLKSVPTCSVLAESAASPDVQGLVGRAYRLNCVINGVNMTMTGDLYWGRHHAYAVFAMFGPMVSDPAEARKFVDSFKVIDPSK